MMPAGLEGIDARVNAGKVGEIVSWHSVSGLGIVDTKALWLPVKGNKWQQHITPVSCFLVHPQAISAIFLLLTQGRQPP